MVAYSKLGECGEDQVPEPTTAHLVDWLRTYGRLSTDNAFVEYKAKLAADRLENAKHEVQVKRDENAKLVHNILAFAELHKAAEEQLKLANELLVNVKCIDGGCEENKPCFWCIKRESIKEKSK